MKSKLRIDLLFVVTGALLFLVEYFAYSSTIGLSFHDTYFVIAPLQVGLLLLIQFSFLGLCYFVFARIRHPLKRSLGLLHYYITSITVLLFALAPLFLVNGQRRFNPDDSFSFLKTMNLVVTISAILFITAQAIFLFNIFRSIFRKSSKA